MWVEGSEETKGEMCHTKEHIAFKEADWEEHGIIVQMSGEESRWALSELRLKTIFYHNHSFQNNERQYLCKVSFIPF